MYQLETNQFPRLTQTIMPVYIFIHTHTHTLFYMIYFGNSSSPVGVSKYISSPGSWSTLLLPSLQQTERILPFIHHSVQSDHRPLNLWTVILIKIPMQQTFQINIMSREVNWTGLFNIPPTFLILSGLGIWTFCLFASCSMVSSMFLSFSSTYLMEEKKCYKQCFVSNREAPFYPVF